MAANSMELLASTRVMCAITSEYFRGLTAVGLSGHMIITRSGPLSGLTSHAASTAPLTISAAASSVRSILGIPSDLRDSLPVGVPHRATRGSNLLPSRAAWSWLVDDSAGGSVLKHPAEHRARICGTP